jgi:hypothetical protein
MTIHNIPPETTKPFAVTQPPARPAAPEPARPHRPEDQVDLSDEARARAAEVPPSEAAGLSPARVVSLRAWLASGGHKDPQIREQVARRMLGLGEV